MNATTKTRIGRVFAGVLFLAAVPAASGQSSSQAVELGRLLRDVQQRLDSWSGRSVQQPFAGPQGRATVPAQPRHAPATGSPEGQKFGRVILHANGEWFVGFTANGHPGDPGVQARVQQRMLQEVTRIMTRRMERSPEGASPRIRVRVRYPGHGVQESLFDGRGWGPWHAVATFLPGQTSSRPVLEQTDRDQPTNPSAGKGSGQAQVDQAPKGPRVGVVPPARGGSVFDSDVAATLKEAGRLITESRQLIDEIRTQEGRSPGSSTSAQGQLDMLRERMARDLGFCRRLGQGRVSPEEEKAWNAANRRESARLGADVGSREIRNKLQKRHVAESWRKWADSRATTSKEEAGSYRDAARKLKSKQKM